MAARDDFAAFYVVTRVRLLRQLTVMTADPELAADVLQEAFARAWQRWRRVSSLENPEAWVRTVAWRIAVSHHRHHLVAADRLRRFFGQDEPVDRGSTTEESMDLRAALFRLRPEHRRALVLYELCGLSVSEVAMETGVPEGTVKSRLSRARQALASVLGDAYLAAGAADRPVEGRVQ